MTLYDSRVLIDYLDGEEEAVEYVEDHIDERAVVPPLVLFEVYQGEVFKSGPADLASVDVALEWVTVVDATARSARATADLQSDLRQHGDPLAARDALIAGTARSFGERLVVADSDFAVDRLTELLDIDFL